MTLTPQDVLAAKDVLADVNEMSDSYAIEEAIGYLEAVTELLTACRETVGLLHAQLVSVLESPRVFNGVLYEVRKSDGKWRPDHSKVDAAVKRAAMVDVDTGEIFDAPDAVDRAIQAMDLLYRSKSTMPKIGALGDLGLKKWDVAEQEPGRPTLKVTPTAEDSKQ